MILKLITAPTTEPITLAEAKAQLRVLHSDEDALIEALIVAARMSVEGVLRRALFSQTWEYSLAQFPAKAELRLPLPPLQSVTSVTYYDTAGTTATFATTGNWYADTASEPGRIVLNDGISWPSSSLRPGIGVVVRYIAGYSTVASIPQTWKQAIMLLIGHYYENREATLYRQAMELPLGVRNLLWPDRSLVFDWDE